MIQVAVEELLERIARLEQAVVDLKADRSRHEKAIARLASLDPRAQR